MCDSFFGKNLEDSNWLEIWHLIIWLVRIVLMICLFEIDFFWIWKKMELLFYFFFFLGRKGKKWEKDWEIDFNIIEWFDWFRNYANQFLLFRKIGKKFYSLFFSIQKQKEKNANWIWKWFDLFNWFLFDFWEICFHVWIQIKKKKIDYFQY